MSLLVGVDLSPVPLNFLEAYPFPALVVHTPTSGTTRPKLRSRDTDVTVTPYHDISPLSESSPIMTNELGLGAGPSVKSRLVWSNEKWIQSHYGAGMDELENDEDFQYWLEDGLPDDLFEFHIQQSLTKLHLAKTTSVQTDMYKLTIITSQVPMEPVNARTPSGDVVANEHRGSTATDYSMQSLDPSPSHDSSGSQSNNKHRNSTRSSTQSSQRHKSRAGRNSPRPDRALAYNRRMLSNTAECWAMMDRIDWAKTSLGPRSGWPPEVDALLAVCFQSPTADALWMGDDFLLLFNIPYLTGVVKDPEAFAKPASQVWSTIWDDIGPVARKAMAGTPTFIENDLMIYQLPGGGLQEHYHTWRNIPIVTKSGQIIGLFNQSIETTEQILAERRLSTVRDLSEHLPHVRTAKEYFESIAAVLGENPHDAPFALCYSVQQDGSSPATASITAKLEATVGVPDDDPSAVAELKLTIPLKTRASFGPNAAGLSSPTLSAISALSSGSGHMLQHADAHTSWPIQKALATRHCVLVNDCRELIQNYEVRAWDELPSSAIVIPICSEGGIEVPEAVIVVGLSCRCPFDREYDAWIHVTRAHLTSALASVKAREAEQKIRDDQVRMERAKTAWFRGAAHDLRSPVALISGPLEDLLDANPTEGQKRQLITAKRNVDRLLRLIDSLMDFSRLEAGRVKGRFVPTDLGAFVNNLAVLFRSAAERLGVGLQVNTEPTERLVSIDPVLCETVISNLLINALKYTENGSITVTVTYGEFAEIRITDTGMGIPPEELGQVAEWFHRSTTAVYSGAQGTGIGLAIAREILHLHDGELVIESVEGQGSSFTAQLPMTARTASSDTSAVTPFGTYGAQMADDALRWMREKTETDNGSEEEVNSSLGSSSRLSEGLLFRKTDKLLLVDDSIELRQYVRRMFTPFCTVLEASNGEEALRMSVEDPPNLILSDVLMPKMGGFELLEAIRADERTRLVPIIMLTAVGSDEARVNSLMLGAEDFITKPFKPKELFARVHLHMQVGKKRAKLEEMYGQRQAEIALLSDYCPSAIMRADDQGRLTYANQAWRDISGMSMEDDPNSWPDFVDEVNQAYLYPRWAEFLNGTAPEVKLTWTWRSGKKTRGAFIKLNQVLAGGTGILGCVVDITLEETRLVEAEQRRLEAEESKRQQELLVDLTSHEIRTPVSAILQCSSLVKENLVALTEQLRWASETGFKPSPELLLDLAEDIEALESIYQCGLVQERIAGDVLSLARIQLDMLSLHDVETDLRKEAKKVVSVFSSEAKMKQIELRLEFGQTLSLANVASVKTDHVRLGQVVTNLISNAIRFTATSSIRRITVTYDVSFAPPEEETCALPSSIDLPDVLPAQEDTPIWLFVAVRDTGPGLGSKELAMLFKRFSQGNKMIHTQYGGSGLGLFICRKITELLGGRIEVQSQLGEGSVFRFFVKTRTTAPGMHIDMPGTAPGDNLPNLLSPSDSDGSRVSTPSDLISTTPPPETLEATRNLHILIVEDNIINQTVLKRQIVKAGLTCDVANNGLEALQLIREADRASRRAGTKRKQPYNAILMDLEMPVMDGLTAVREIRQAETAGTLGRQMVIALTGNARQGQIDAAIEAGMDDVVIKPYVLANLLKKIREISAKRAAIEAEEQ